MNLSTMKLRVLALITALSLASGAQAATVNFGGSFRSEAGSYNNLGLGLANVNPTKNFISARALLNPNLVVDDHFSIKSQWSLLSSPNFTPAANQGLGVGQGSWLFGDPFSASLTLSRAWLEWTSDIGVFRIGRMPVSWGYGILYDAGDGIWDDFQTNMDRIEYRLHLGYVVGALAYSKNRKISVLGNENDQEYYTAYLRYDNPEVEVEAGLMFEKQQRAGNQAGDLVTNNAYHQPGVVKGGTTAPFIARSLPTPISDNVLDVYLKKTSGYFSYGGEVAWASGTAVDNSGVNGGFNSFGVMVNAAVDYRKVKSFLEVMFVSGDDNLNDGNTTAFTLANRNRRPGLILGRELIGPYYGNNLNQGSLFSYGGNGAFSGVLYFRPGVRIDWSPTLTSAVEVIYARKATDVATGDLSLGLEIDVGTDYAVYKNFRLGGDLGVLFPGAGIAGSSSPAFALRTTASLNF